MGIPIIGSLVEKGLGAITSIFDDLHTSDEEKSEAKLKAMRVFMEHSSMLEQSYQAEIEAKQAVMVAEIKSDDAYTRRARPTIVYTGLAAMVVNHIVLPWVAHFGGGAVPAINLPGEFWYAWGGVVGLYAWRRTDEKIKPHVGS